MAFYSDEGQQPGYDSNNSLNKNPENVPFNVGYQFQRNNTVVVKGPHGKHLRVSPQSTNHADGNGGHGHFAQWHAILYQNNIVRFTQDD